jgi:holliday junction DNA helicase RuvB
MLRPVTETIEITPDLYRQIAPHVLRPIFAKGGARRRITISAAKDLLAAAVPQYVDVVRRSIRMPASGTTLAPREIGLLLHEALGTVAAHLRQAGADHFRGAQATSDPGKRQQLIWDAAFAGLQRWLDAGGLLQRPEALETLDIVVECVRLWASELAERVSRFQEAVEPTAFFLDTEQDLAGSVGLNGQTLHLRGRPDAVFLDRAGLRPEIVEYKFGEQGQLELQVAQTVLYIALVDAAKGPGIESGRLLLFRLEEERPLAASAPAGNRAAEPAAEWPAQVETAFEGYIGNAPAVRRLKRTCAAALQQNRRATGLNVMLCGPAGLGKTELARRVAKALQLPLVDVPGHRVKSVDDILDLAERALKTEGRDLEDAGEDSGLPLHRYPPCVVFVDEVHLLKSRADDFLNMFEPKDRRGVGKRRVADLTQVTFLAATTDRGLLPPAFLTRFRIVELQPYNEDEIAQIIRPLFISAGKPVDEDFLRALGRVGRLNPRVTKDRAQELLEPDPRGPALTAAVLVERAREDWHVDERGLENSDRRYLKALLPGPRGLTALSGLLQLKPEEIRTRIEPYLLQLELVRATNRGREITELGRDALAGHTSAT